MTLRLLEVWAQDSSSSQMFWRGYPNMWRFVVLQVSITALRTFQTLLSSPGNFVWATRTVSICSIEFDKDGELFVVAGVSNKIKLYDFNSVAYGESSNHYPLTQLQCTSKISNVSYNPHLKSLLSSSDYDGHVRLWASLSIEILNILYFKDTDACKNIRTFSEHEKRCWTVQFNNVRLFYVNECFNPQNRWIPTWWRPDLMMQNWSSGLSILWILSPR